MKFQANILQAIVAMLLVCDGNISFCAEVPNSLDEVETTLRQAPLFKEPLIWVGSERPPESQTRALYEIAAVEAWNDNASADEKVSRFESFIAQYPDSAWNPALLANLGVYYRSEGRYTKALERWSEAWRRTANLTDYRSRHVAAFTAAYWSQLLSSLGRIDDMEALLAVVKTDVTAKSLFAKEIEAANRSLAIMKNQPAAAFRCGTFALFHAAQAFGEASKCQSLLSLNSPRSGFSLQNLVEFSANYQLGFAAVHRGSGGELIVPSVVHWKENHYAAIVEKRRGAYKVIDPTFGGSKWLSAAVINENASGYFLIQSGDHPASWRSVDPDEASTVFGKGIENNGEPNPSGCPCGTCPPPCAPGSPGSGNGGNGPGSCGSACGVRVGAAKAGMPDWEVQEPYISLWLHDRPMFYDLSLGGQFALDMTYHQRETRAAPGSWNTNVFNFGPSWNCNLLTYILVKGTVTHDQETVDCDPESESECCTQAVVTGNIELSEFAPKGGLRRHVWDGELAPWLRDTRTHAQLKPVGYDTVTTLPSACGYSYDQRVVHFKTATLDYPDGSTAAFGLVVTTSTLPEEKLAFITSLTNPQGQVMRYHYYTNVSVPNKPIVRLAHVVDFDGNTNSFLYEDANFSSAVTAITNANYKLGVAFRYDTNGFLTNIVDTIGLASSFQYTFTNDLFFQGYNTNGQPGNPDQYGGFTEPPHTNQVWLLTRMSTPYGDTSFEYIHPTWRMFTPSSAPSVEAEINRAIRVTQPDGGTHLFMYLDRHNPMVTGPYLYPTLCGSEGSDYLENYLVFKQRTSKHADIHLVDFNSYYWGPRQYARLSTTVITNFNYTDYRGARVRNWLHSNPDVNDFSTSQTLNAEQAPSPDPENSVSSQSIWYGYEGKPADADIVESQSDNIPVTVGYQTDDFAIRIQNSWRNTQGLVTKTVDFGSDVSCEHFIKTNLYVYAANGIDLVKHIGPGNLMLGGYAYNAFHQITFATNALGEVTSYTYVSNRLTSTKLPSGLITTNIYGANGFIAVTYDYAVVAGTPVYYRTNAYTYTNGLVFTHTDERGLTVTNTWDKLQRLLSVKYSDGRSISYTYDKLDLVRIVDRMGFTNSFVYDNMQRKIFETNALGRVTAYSYCTCGSLNSVQDAAGQNTFFYYDNLGRLTNTLFADGFSIRREYDLASQIRRTIDSSGHTVIKTYDGEGNLQAVDKDHPIGPQRTAQFSYDIYDRVTTNINAEGVKVTMTYDPLGRLRTRTYPDNGVESFGYTLNVSGATSYTNQLNQVTRYVYDPLERKTAETNANLEVTRFVYNGAGDLLTLTDGKNQTTAWKYDSFGRVTNKLDHLGTNLF
ncbi:MAG TPA: cysteine peptidase family C39 domain-containing protein, partial [Verrucomicrobiae bacterium]|nr:cysteine peptidase family C39 domain-containing protein [Verrucomicrobiae bacterium]